MTDLATLLPRGRFRLASDAIAGLGTDVVELTGDRKPAWLLVDPALEALGVVQRALQALAAAGVDGQVHRMSAGEPSAATVAQAAQRLRESGAGCVVGIGGGSALDVAKLAAVLSTAPAPAARYALARRPLPARSVPVVLVPTTAGTGSEATTTAIFSIPDGRKLWVWGESLRPDRAILDPTLCTDLPAPVTAATGADALVHAIEAATGRNRSATVERDALAGIDLITRHLPRAVHSPRDEEARAAMLVAAALAGLAIDRAGTGVAHALGHGLGAIARVHHGRAVALALRAAIAWNAEGAPARYARLAPAFGLGAAGSTARAAREVAGAFEGLLRTLPLAWSLAEDGLTPAAAPRLVQATLARENTPMRKNNARRVTRAALEHLAADLLAYR